MLDWICFRSKTNIQNYSTGGKSAKGCKLALGFKPLPDQFEEFIFIGEHGRMVPFFEEVDLQKIVLLLQVFINLVQVIAVLVLPATRH